MSNSTTRSLADRIRNPFTALGHWADEQSDHTWVVREEQEVKAKDGTVSNEERVQYFKTAQRIAAKIAGIGVKGVEFVINAVGFVAHGVIQVVATTADFVHALWHNTFGQLFEERDVIRGEATETTIAA